jgi:hypothetical protein
LGRESSPGVRAQPVIAEPKNTHYTGTCGETHYLDGTNIEMQFIVDKDAPLALAQIRFRGRGVFDGKTIERTARARYFKRRIRHIGDAEEDEQLSPMLRELYWMCRGRWL